MLIYNITTKVENEIVEEWLQWTKDVHIHEIMSTGFFSAFDFFKLLGHDESDGTTYILQFIVQDKSALNSYKREHDERIKNNARRKWGAAFITFESLLESVK